jgi:uncharacterized protein (TIGR03435 family)
MQPRFLLGASAALMTIGLPATSPLSAQKPQVVFDAASVKRSDTGQAGGGVGLRPGGYAAANTLLRTIVAHAYQMKRAFVVGGPDWIDGERFDITARASGDATEEELFAMIRALLADRFRLVAHLETRELPIYSLVRARSDGRLGANLRRSAPDCAAAGNPCGMTSTGFTNGAGVVITKGRTVGDLASTLGGMLDRNVIDNTGLSGTYEIDLKWGPDEVRPGAAAAESELPPIFTAIQEQLGLRLQPARGPVTVLVIDSAQRPTRD